MRPTIYRNTITRGIYAAFLQGRFEEVTSCCTPSIQRQLPRESIAQLWSTLLGQGGGAPPEEPPLFVRALSQDKTVITFPFPSKTLDMVLTWQKDQDIICGMHFVPARKVYIPDAETEETQVTLCNGQLPATLRYREGMTHVVLLVHGSGPQDRDVTMGPNAPFRDMARQLAARGIATLRYEKRTYAALETINPVSFTINDEVVADASEMVKWLRKERAFEKVFIVGHSLGGYAAPRIVESCGGASAVSGAVILCGNARPLEDLIWDQVNYLNPSGDHSALKESIERVRRGEFDGEGLPLSLCGSYWKDLAGYRPAEVAAKQKDTVPFLVLMAGRDYQVTSADATLWGQSGHTITVFPDLDHMLVSGEGPSRGEDYFTPGRVVSEEVSENEIAADG